MSMFEVSSAGGFLLAFVMATVLVMGGGLVKSNGMPSMFARDVSQALTGVLSEGAVWMPLFLVLYLVIAVANLLSLNAATFAAYAQYSLCFALASLVFLLSLLSLCVRYGFKMLSTFFPAGVPLWLAPLLVSVEALSFAFRLVSLSTRLFANLTAGHVLLALFSGAAWSSSSLTFSLGLLAALPAAASLMVFLCLELFVALLQPAIFVLLSAIYLAGSVPCSLASSGA